MYAATIFSVALFALQALAGPLAASPESAQLAPRQAFGDLKDVATFKDGVPKKCTATCKPLTDSMTACAKTPNARLSCGCEEPTFLDTSADCLSCILSTRPDKRTQAEFQNLMDITHDVCTDAGFKHAPVKVVLPPGTPNGAATSAAARGALAVVAGVASAAMLL